MTRQRKRVSPENEYDRFYDKARANGYDVLVERWVHDAQELLKVRAVRGAQELEAPSVLDITQLALSVAGLDDLIEREAA